MSLYEFDLRDVLEHDDNELRKESASDNSMVFEKRAYKDN